MSLNARSQEMMVGMEPFVGPSPRVPTDGRILIICDDASLTERLRTIFTQAKFISETARGITEACEVARSRRFQVIFTVPVMRDGSWLRLIDVAKHYDLGLEVILLARDFDLKQWANTLNDGAFDVLNVSYEVPNAAKAATSAFWAVYLRGAGPLPECLLKSACPQNAA